MNTKCYCILCPKHPLYAKRKELKILTGFQVGDTIWKSEHLASSADVECLAPASKAFDELDIDPKDYEFPVTAYGDGNSQTGFEGNGYTITAYCENEEYVDADN